MLKAAYPTYGGHETAQGQKYNSKVIQMTIKIMPR